MQTHFAWSALGDRVALGALAGACGGVIAGLGARFAMRMVADAIGLFPILSVAGTLNILTAGFVLGMLPGAIYGIIKPVLPGPALVHGLLTGLVLCGAMGVLLLTQPADGEFAAAPEPLAEVLFGLLTFVYGLALVLFYHAFEVALRSRLSR